MRTKYPLVIPAIEADLQIIIENINILKKFLPISCIYIIGPSCISSSVERIKGLKYINERNFVNIEKIIDIFKERLHEPTRVGWYVQQFVKIAFATICEDEYYILWDSDTIPTTTLDFFDEKHKPFFDIKTEYHKPYFNTLRRILPKCEKEIMGSFISEHMVVKTSFMLEMITTIEENTSIKGSNFMEKIVYAISSNDLPKSGFSEYETYGNYVMRNFPTHYSLRKWESLRYGSFFFNRGTLSQQQLKWLSEYFDAISFEKGQTISKTSRLIGPTVIMQWNPKILVYISFFIRVKRALFGRGQK